MIQFSVLLSIHKMLRYSFQIYCFDQQMYVYRFYANRSQPPNGLYSSNKRTYFTNIKRLLLQNKPLINVPTYRAMVVNLRHETVKIGSLIIHRMALHAVMGRYTTIY